VFGESGGECVATELERWRDGGQVTRCAGYNYRRMSRVVLVVVVVVVMKMMVVVVASKTKMDEEDTTRQSQSKDAMSAW
jgi:uncharacterized membrane protein